MGLVKYNVQNSYIDKSGYLVCDVEFDNTNRYVHSLYIEQINNVTNDIYKYSYKYVGNDTNVGKQRYNFKINTYSDEYVQSDKSNIYTFQFGYELDESSYVHGFAYCAYSGPYSGALKLKALEIDNAFIVSGNINPLSLRCVYFNFGSNTPDVVSGYYDVIKTTYESGVYYYWFNIPNIGTYITGTLSPFNLLFTLPTYLLPDTYNYMDINYIHENLDNKRLIDISTADKIYNLSDNQHIGFLTNYKTKLIPYLDEANLVEQTGAGVYKMGNFMVTNFTTQTGNNSLFKKGSGTMSMLKDNVKIYDKLLDVNSNGYIFGKKTDTKLGGLEYKFNLTGLSASNVIDTITAINILSPSYSLCSNKEWVNIKYINPYGVWDSMTLFGTITESVDVKRDFGYYLGENNTINKAKLNVTKKNYITNNAIDRIYTFDSDYVDYNTYRQFGEIVESKYHKILTNSTPITYTYSGTFSSVNLDYKDGNIPTDGFGNYYINAGYNIQLGGAFGTISYTQLLDETGNGSYPIDPFYAILPNIQSVFAPTYSVELVTGIGTYPNNFALKFTSNRNENLYDILTYSNSPISATGVNGIFNNLQLNNRLPGVADPNVYEDIIINNTSFDYKSPKEYRPLKLDFNFSSVKKSRN